MGKGSAIVNLLLGLWPLLVALPAMLFWSFRPSLGLPLALATMLLGFVLFAAAKFTSFRSGRWVSFGTRDMPLWARYAYISGLVITFVGAIGSLAASLRW